MKTLLAQHLYIHHKLSIEEIGIELGWTTTDVKKAVSLLTVPGAGLFETPDARKEFLKRFDKETAEEKRAMATRQMLGGKPSSWIGSEIKKEKDAKVEKEQNNRDV